MSEPKPKPGLERRREPFIQVVEMESGARALLLDRDGTINVDDHYVHRIEDFVFIKGIFELCRAACGKGYRIIVITNQSGIERGYYTHEDFRILTDWMKARFLDEGVVVDDVLYCPSLSGFDRKPNPGMFFRARDRFGLNLAESVSIGDKPRDVEAGTAAGVGTNLLFLDSNLYSYLPKALDPSWKDGGNRKNAQPGANSGIDAECHPSAVIGNLLEALPFL